MQLIGQKSTLYSFSHKLKDILVKKNYCENFMRIVRIVPEKITVEFSLSFHIWRYHYRRSKLLIF